MEVRLRRFKQDDVAGEKRLLCSYVIEKILAKTSGKFSNLLLNCELELEAALITQKCVMEVEVNELKMLRFL